MKPVTLLVLLTLMLFTVGATREEVAWDIVDAVERCSPDFLTDTLTREVMHEYIVSKEIPNGIEAFRDALAERFPHCFQ